MSREQVTQGQPPLFTVVKLARTRLRSLLADSRPIVAYCALMTALSRALAGAGVAELLPVLVLVHVLAYALMSCPA